MNLPISLTINGISRDIALDDPRVTLLDLCASASILPEPRRDATAASAVPAPFWSTAAASTPCLALAVSHDGAEIVTIEGVAHGDRLHPVQAAFIAHDGFQCGFCTPGQIMSGIGLNRGGPGGLRSGAGARMHERQSLPLRRLSRDYRGRARGAGHHHRCKTKALRMMNFDYVRPAMSLMRSRAGSEQGAAYLASGTNLLDLMKGGVSRPSCLVDVTRLPGLDRIEHSRRRLLAHRRAGAQRRSRA